MPNLMSGVACSDDDAQGLRAAGSKVPRLWVQLAVRAVAGAQGAGLHFF